MKLLRNRYYQGKPLNSDDFILEQAYMRNQFSALFSAFFGMGIVKGLALKKKKNAQLLLEQGSAIDAQGRMIHVHTDTLFDLRELQGFSQLEEGAADIMLQYEEIPQKRNGEKEAGAVEEAFSLRLSSLPHKQLKSSFWHEEILYEDNSFTLMLLLPAFLPVKGKVEACLQLEKRTSANVQVGFTLQGNHWQTKEEDSLCVSFFNTKKTEESIRFPLYKKERTMGKRAVFRIIDIKVQIDQEEKNVKECHFRLPMVEDIRSKLKEALYRCSLHELDAVPLGTVRFHKDGEAVVIDELTLTSALYSCRPVVLQYMEALIQQYGYEPEIKKEKKEAKVLQKSGSIIVQVEEDETLAVSEEYPHGLGCGNIWMSAAFLNFAPDSTNQQDFIFGNAALFEEMEGRWDIGIRVLRNRGTFQCAVKAPLPHASMRLQIAWYACAFPPLEENEDIPMLLRLEPSAITLAPFSSCTFTPVFLKEDDMQDVEFEVCDVQGGEIDEEGNYYAPAESGIYQLCASCQKERVYAYVKVVKEDEPL